jgi:hypothetical protein
MAMSLACSADCRATFGDGQILITCHLLAALEAAKIALSVTASSAIKTQTAEQHDRSEQ